MKSYHDLLRKVLDEGVWSNHARTGKRTLHLFGAQLEFDLSEGFPLLTSRKVPYKNMLKELLWFLSGSTDNKVLESQNCPVWKLWAVRSQDICSRAGTNRKANIDSRGQRVRVGECGPIYGKMWRHWPAWDGSTIDQIQYVIDTLKANPSSRRLVVSAWNPDVLPDETLTPQENVFLGKQALPPCHTLFQFSAEALDLGSRYAAALSNPLISEGKKHVCRQDLAMLQRWADRDEAPTSWFKFAQDLFLGRSVKQKKLTWEQRIRQPEQALDSLHDFLDRLGVPRYKLHMKLYARSQDLPLGTAFNIPCFSALLMMMAKEVKMLPGRYIHTMGDAHIYEDQIPGVKKLLERKPGKLPTLQLSDRPENIFEIGRASCRERV